MPRTPFYDSVDAALGGADVPREIREKLRLISIFFFGFDGREHEGQMMLTEEVVEDVSGIFSQLLAARFPIERMVPIQYYDSDDELSMRDNNTSAFNYRLIASTERLSNHALGRAIDINPRINPSYPAPGQMLPENGTYDPSIPGTITVDSLAVKLFKERGWRWLGDREEAPDYQHFDKAE